MITIPRLHAVLTALLTLTIILASCNGKRDRLRKEYDRDPGAYGRKYGV